MNEVEEMFHRAFELARLEPVKRLRVRVPRELVGFEIEIPRARARSVQCQTQSFFALSQGERLLLNPAKHLIERIGKQSQLVSAQLGRAHRVIVFGRYRSRSVGQGQ